MSVFDEIGESVDGLLKIYYRKLFPCELFARWLTYGSKNPSELLSRREFSFSLADDVYVRYQSFNDAYCLRKELVKSSPHKIDIGAVYSAPPKLQRSLSMSTFKPEWKELVFDIDLTDYDEIRFCCGAKNTNAASAMCVKCWQLAKFAVLCLDRSLREDFGFEHLLWVFSGRRGVHCWVCDSVARRLDATSRTAIVEYLSLVRTTESRKCKSLRVPKDGRGIEPQLHPSIESAVGILKPYIANFVSDTQGQSLLSHPDGIKWLLNLLPPDMAAERHSLEEQWNNNDSEESGLSDLSLKRWNTLQRFLTNNGRSNVLKDIIINTIYPRLDANVTTGVNHLLKSPFCAHPKTGFICVPFDPSRIEEFDPTTVPKLTQLIEELSSVSVKTEETDADEISERHLLAYKRTSLRSSIEFFEQFIQKLCPLASDSVSVLNNTEKLDHALPVMV